MRHRESQNTEFTYEKEVSKIEEECGEEVEATLSRVGVLKVAVVLLVFHSLQSLHYHSAKEKNIIFTLVGISALSCSLENLVISCRQCMFLLLMENYHLWESELLSFIFTY